MITGLEVEDSLGASWYSNFQPVTHFSELWFLYLANGNSVQLSLLCSHKDHKNEIKISWTYSEIQKTWFSYLLSFWKIISIYKDSVIKTIKGTASLLLTVIKTIKGTASLLLIVKIQFKQEQQHLCENMKILSMAY